MDEFKTVDLGLLNEAGLNRQAFFNIGDLPAGLAVPLQERFNGLGQYRQLLLIGHAGKRLWDAVQASGIDSENPIDDFSVRVVKDWFSRHLPGRRYEIIYPGPYPIGLQQLGKLAGWHRPSPFMVGIDPEWGSWYAYRAVVLADTAFEPSRPVPGGSPCLRCAAKVCIATCPGAALEGGFDLKKCAAYRIQAGSACRNTCLARLSCPVGAAHRYSDEQMSHCYGRSLRDLERYC
ncbi:MAG: hypothetical protein H6R10_1906 [Rhodocyclaceae bacterium]|nr:hypothetical protein [Rhodocyclaceae bacterium]